MSEILEKIKDSKKDLFVGLAGPGTGKSYTFKRIINSPEFEDDKILVLSFINKLVDDLKNDFNEFENVKVSTLHAFARSHLTKVIDDDIDLDQYLDDIVSEDYYLIEGFDVSFEKKFFGNNLTSEEEEFYRKRSKFYQWKNKLYSFNSVIYSIALLFSKKEELIPEKYDLILIDEFQDFNELEWNFIKLLARKSKIILVGDDDQSLYTWKLAKPDKIRMLYDHKETESFTMDYCYRCPKVIIDAVNNLISSANNKGLLKDNKNKSFEYPPEPPSTQLEASEKYPKIDFIPSVIGNLLIYKLSEKIKRDIKGEDKKRILVLVPSYLKQSIYEGLTEKGFIVVGYELFSDQEKNNIKHKSLIDIFNTLTDRKTDNLALRKILPFYLSEDEIKSIVIDSKNKDKKIWNCLNKNVKSEIEEGIRIFKKAKKGEDYLSDSELDKFSKLFNLKNIISKMIKGFDSHDKSSIEVEMTTVMSSKGLSADFVYYVGVDDYIIASKKDNSMTDRDICEFLVGITRTKKKLTFISLKNEDPKILEFINKDHINKIK